MRNRNAGVRTHRRVVAMSRYVLVTGGAGYIGSHTCKELAKRGVVPVTFDNLSRGFAHAVKWGPLVIGDLANPDDIRAVFAKFDISAVIHFAAFAYVGESVSNPGAYFRNNIGGTLNLVHVMAERRIRHLVFSSTCAVYGIPQSLPIREDSPTAPINPYGESKLQVEKILSWYANAHDLGWIALRYFNAAGADPDGDIGENHDPETHLIPLAIKAALGNGPALSVFGNDHPTADGTPVRDYIHVSDLADAHIRALGRLSGGAPSGIFNLGTGTGASVRQIIAEVEAVTGLEVPHVFAERRAGDPPELVADPQRAFSALGWRPRHSDLATIIRSATDWERRGRIAEETGKSTGRGPAKLLQPGFSI
jgi:UDP-glucose-4-epimerase GalE